MNFVAFKYFNEVAKTGSIRRAADRLHVAPSAVSRQLAQLEQRLGTPLLERTNTGIKLTPAGVMVENYTLGMFHDLERLQATIKDFKGLQEGEVKLWVMEGIISNFLPRVISSFNERYPAIQFTVFSDSTDRIVEALIRNEADIGVVYNARPRPEIEIIAQHKEPVMCLMAPTHPFAARRSVTLADICGQSIALPFSSFGLRQIFEQAVLRQKLTATVTLSSSTIELTKSMTVLGRTLTIAPALAARNEIQQGLLKAVPIDDVEFAGVTSAICIHHDRPLSYAAAAFLEKIAGAFTTIGGADDSCLRAPAT